MASLEPAVSELCGLEQSLVLRTVGTTPGTSLPRALGTVHLPHSSVTDSTLYSGSGVLGAPGEVSGWGSMFLLEKQPQILSCCRLHFQAVTPPALKG